MKKVKMTMKQFFAAILCFLVNLIPGKKIMTVKDAGENVWAKNSAAGFWKNGTSSNRINEKMYGRQYMTHLNDYIVNIEEYMNYLEVKKYIGSDINNDISFAEYKNTG